jgi:hypothetical protein
MLFPILQYSSTPLVLIQDPLWGQTKAWSSGPGFFTPVYGYMVKGVSTAAGLKSGQFNRERNFDLEELVKKQITNIES